MKNRRIIGIILVLALLSSLMAVEAMAAQTAHGAITGRHQAQMTTQLATASDSADGPSLAPGNHERWIDRIHQLPDYATDFYAWLETNAQDGGALTDPTMGQLIQGSSGSYDTYIHRFHTIEGSASFTYSGSGHATAAQNAVLKALGNDHITAVNYATAVYGAFDRDHPEVFWLSGSSLYGYNVPYDYTYFAGRGTVTYSVELYFFLQDPEFDLRNPAYQDPTALSTAMAVQDARVEEILADCPDTGVYDQIFYLNRVLTQTNAYNSDVAVGNQANASKDAWKGISALKGSVGTQGPVCEGYARAFKILCNELDIPCVLVEGPARASDSAEAVPHMWNNVKLDDGWYAVDSTWNDPYSFGMSQVACTGLETEDWMLLGADSRIGGLPFAQSHTVTNYTTQNSLCYTNGPELALDAYEPKAAEPVLTLKYPTLTFEDVITMNVFFQAENLEDVVQMGLITYKSQVSEWNVENAEAVIPGYELDPSGFYVASTQGIPAKDMGDTFWFAVYAKLTDGTYTYTKLVSYSPTTYAANQLSDPAMSKLVIAMLNYGAAAQTYFGYNTDSLMNAELTAEQNASIESYRADMLDSISTVTAEKSANFVRTTAGFATRYPTITFEGAFSIDYLCQPSATPVGDITLYYWDQAAFDAADALTVDNATGALALVNNNGTYATAVEGIAAKDLDKGVYVAFCYSDGTNDYCSGILGYSIGMYCQGKAAGEDAMAPFAAATAVYGYYAKQMFN